MEAEERKHNKAVNQLRTERRAAVAKITRATADLDSILNSLALDVGDTLIRWDDFKEMQVGMQLHISEDLYFIKYFERGDQMGFKIFLKAGASFGLQQHDCLEETTVLRGNLIETYRNHREYTEGQTVTYVDCQLHKPYCTVDSVYRAVFTRRNKIRIQCKEK